jgi:hypothetical protein
MGRRAAAEERQKAAGLVQQAYSGGYEHPIEVCVSVRRAVRAPGSDVSELVPQEVYARGGGNCDSGGDI